MPAGRAANHRLAAADAPRMIVEIVTPYVMAIALVLAQCTLRQLKNVHPAAPLFASATSILAQFHESDCMISS
jgi:hypothetical protein